MSKQLRILILSVILFSILPARYTIAQINNYFRGRIINSTDSRPVPFATIRLKNNQIGIYANAEGDFIISSKPEFESDSVIITCIGFRRTAIAYSGLSEGKTNIIYLNPAVYNLGEVKVEAKRRKLGSEELIARAIRRIKDNYPEKPFSYISYYRDYQKEGKNYYNLNEAIVQTMDNGFKTRSVKDRYRLLEFRINSDFPRMSLSPYYTDDEPSGPGNFDKYIPNAELGDQYGNELFILMTHDAIRNYKVRSFSYINTLKDDFLYNHFFSDPEEVYDNNLLLDRIDFTGKSRILNNAVTVSGSIYIQPRDFSIYKLIYSCYYKNKDKEPELMFSIDTEYGHENATDPLMYLKYISFNNIFYVIDPADTTYFRIDDSYWDPADAAGNKIVIRFNNKIDPESAQHKDYYDIIVNNIRPKILSIKTKGKLLYLTLTNENLKGLKDSTWLNIKNLKDIDGNILDKRKVQKLYQYRELFVEDYNRKIGFSDSCYMKYLPLDKNCIAKSPGTFNYWMNTPENIKDIK